ncbi:hypothetical protein T439DRAFT_328361 [Meredithblackwellia eburnea MCA 4105]
MSFVAAADGSGDEIPQAPTAPINNDPHRRRARAYPGDLSWPEGEADWDDPQSLGRWDLYLSGHHYNRTIEHVMFFRRIRQFWYESRRIPLKKNKENGWERDETLDDRERKLRDDLAYYLGPIDGIDPLSGGGGLERKKKQAQLDLIAFTEAKNADPLLEDLPERGVRDRHYYYLHRAAPTPASPNAIPEFVDLTSDQDGENAGQLQASQDESDEVIIVEKSEKSEKQKGKQRAISEDPPTPRSESSHFFQQDEGDFVFLSEDESSGARGSGASQPGAVEEVDRAEEADESEIEFAASSAKIIVNQLRSEGSRRSLRSSSSTNSLQLRPFSSYFSAEPKPTQRVQPQRTDSLSTAPVSDEDLNDQRSAIVEPPSRKPDPGGSPEDNPHHESKLQKWFFITDRPGQVNKHNKPLYDLQIKHVFRKTADSPADLLDIFFPDRREWIEIKGSTKPKYWASSQEPLSSARKHSREVRIVRSDIVGIFPGADLDRIQNTSRVNVLILETTYSLFQLSNIQDKSASEFLSLLEKGREAQICGKASDGTSKVTEAEAEKVIDEYENKRLVDRWLLRKLRETEHNPLALLLTRYLPRPSYVEPYVYDRLHPYLEQMPFRGRGILKTRSNHNHDAWLAREWTPAIRREQEFIEQVAKHAADVNAVDVQLRNPLRDSYAISNEYTLFAERAYSLDEVHTKYHIQPFKKAIINGNTYCAGDFVLVLPGVDATSSKGKNGESTPTGKNARPKATVFEHLPLDDEEEEDLQDLEVDSQLRQKLNSSTFWVAQVVYFYRLQHPEAKTDDEESDNKNCCVHMRWMEREKDSFIGKRGHPMALFASKVCSEESTDVIVKKVNVERLSRGQCHPSAPDVLFYSLLYDQSDLSFVDAETIEGAPLANEERFEQRHVVHCLSCDQELSTHLNNEAHQGPTRGSLRIRGVTYLPGDWVVVRAQQKGTPCRLAQFMFAELDSSRDNETYQVRVTWLYRRDDFPLRQVDITEDSSPFVRDDRHLVLSHISGYLSPDDLDGKFTLQHKNEWNPEVDLQYPSRFYYHLRLSVFDTPDTPNPPIFRPKTFPPVPPLPTPKSPLEELEMKFQKRSSPTSTMSHGTVRFNHGLPTTRTFQELGLKDDVLIPAPWYEKTGKTSAGFHSSSQLSRAPSGDSPDKGRAGFFELYSGVGGLCSGLKEGCPSLDLKLAVDCDKFAKRALNSNVNNVFEKRCSDLLEAPSDVPGFERQAAETPILISGGSPCQGFSIINLYKVVGDPRCWEPFVFLSWVHKYRPVFFLYENVRAFANFPLPGSEVEGPRRGGLRGMMISLVISWGYQVREGVINAACHGVAQNRRRYFMLGALRGVKLPDLPRPTHAADMSFLELDVTGATHRSRTSVVLHENTAPLHAAVTVGDVLSDLTPFGWKDPTPQDLEDGDLDDDWSGHPNMFDFKSREPIVCPTEEYRYLPLNNAQRLLRRVQNYDLDADSPFRISDTVSDHECSGWLEKDYIERFCKIKGSWADVQHEKWAPDVPPRLQRLVNSDNKSKSKKGIDLLKLFWSRLDSHSLLTPMRTSLNVDGVSHGPRIHPDQHRQLSIREMARLQGFRDHWTFKGSNNERKYSDQIRLIGNAVPVDLARAIGRSLDKVVQQMAANEGFELARTLSLFYRGLTESKWTVEGELGSGKERDREHLADKPEERFRQLEGPTPYESVLLHASDDVEMQNFSASSFEGGENDDGAEDQSGSGSEPPALPDFRGITSLEDDDNDNDNKNSSNINNNPAWPKKRSCPQSSLKAARPFKVPKLHPQVVIPHKRRPSAPMSTSVSSSSTGPLRRQPSSHFPTPNSLSPTSTVRQESSDASLSLAAEDSGERSTSQVPETDVESVRVGRSAMAPVRRSQTIVILSSDNDSEDEVAVLLGRRRRK